METRHWYSVPAYHGTETLLVAGGGGGAGEGVLALNDFLTRFRVVLLAFWSEVDDSVEALRLLFRFLEDSAGSSAWTPISEVVLGSVPERVLSKMCS